MADHTHIEWTDATWNPITGCSVVSPGCTNCYAMRLAGTRLKHVESRKGLTIETKAGPVWNGEVRLNAKDLDQPLRWRRPRLIFVCAHGDLFHESVPDAWIDRVFAVMALSPQHTFQVLTKRAARMREYLSEGRQGAAARNILDMWIAGSKHARKAAWGDDWPVVSIGDIDDPDDVKIKAWPLPNVWLGVSAEDQARANERIPDLLGTPAAVRFLSAEPLLGAIDLLGTLARWQDDPFRQCAVGLGRQLINWVIVGGESGPCARPMHPDWARSLRDQCAAAGVAFFFKQWGEWAPHTRDIEDDDGLIRTTPRGGPTWRAYHPGPGAISGSFRVGKARAGRLLDGAEHNGMPEIAR